MNIKYPLADPFHEEDYNSLIEWLKTHPRLTKDKLTKQLEQKWADFIGTKYSVFVNSGSSANLLMIYELLLKLNKKAKDINIIVPSVGWVTTIAPIIQFGMNPIMVDADPDTYGVDLNQIEDICKKQKIDAIIFVQVLGVPHKLELLKLKEKYGFILLEDACAALGARYSDDRMVGSIGDMSSFSFYAGHQLTTIEGGMVNTNDYKTYQDLMMLRSHGWGKDLDQFVYDEYMEKYEVDKFHQPFTFFIPGFNVRATDLQAFIGLKQMDIAYWIVERRNENHLRYAKNLNGYIEYQKWNDNYPVSISFGGLTITNQQRKEIVKKLVENGIETRLFSAGNLGLHPFWYNEYGKFNGKIANEIHNRGFFLPNNPNLKIEDIDFICDIVKSI